MKTNKLTLWLVALIAATLSGCRAEHFSPWDSYIAYMAVAGLTVCILAGIINRKHKEDEERSDRVLIRAFYSLVVSIVVVWLAAFILTYCFSSYDSFVFLEWSLFLIGLTVMTVIEVRFWLLRKKVRQITRPTEPAQEPQLDEAKWEKCPQCGTVNPKGFNTCLKCEHIPHPSTTTTTTTATAPSTATPTAEPAPEPAQVAPVRDPAPQISSARPQRQAEDKWRKG
jgi:hypothetical protein